MCMILIDYNPPLLFVQNLKAAWKLILQTVQSVITEQSDYLHVDQLLI